MATGLPKPRHQWSGPFGETGPFLQHLLIVCLQTMELGQITLPFNPWASINYICSQAESKVYGFSPQGFLALVTHAAWSECLYISRVHKPCVTGALSPNQRLTIKAQSYSVPILLLLLVDPDSRQMPYQICCINILLTIRMRTGLELFPRCWVIEKLGKDIPGWHVSVRSRRKAGQESHLSEGQWGFQRAQLDLGLRLWTLAVVMALSA